MLTGHIQLNELSGPGTHPGGVPILPGSIAQQAAILLYSEVKAGNGLAAACRFMEFLRRQGIARGDGGPLLDINDLSSLVQRVDESPAGKRADTLRLIEGLFPRQQ